MGGRVAEELIFGKDLITTGAQNDFETATHTAKMMIQQFGMGSGTRTMSQEDGPVLQEQVDSEIDHLLQSQYQRGMEILLAQRPTLDLIAEELRTHESLDLKQL